MTALWSAVCVLALAVLLNLMLTLGLARRLRVASRTAGAATDPAVPKAGTRVGPFSIPVVGGDAVTTDDLASGIVEAAFLSVGCEPCARVKQELLDRGPATRSLMTFVVGAGDDPAAQRIADDLSTVSSEIAIVNVDSSVVKAFDIRAYPTLILLNDGVVQRAGWQLDAIDPGQVG